MVDMGICIVSIPILNILAMILWWIWRVFPWFWCPFLLFFPQLHPKSDSRTPRQNIHQLGFPQSKSLGSWLAKSYCLFYLYQNALSVDILVIQHVLISQMLSDAVMNLRTRPGHLKTKDPTHAMQPRRCSCEFPSKKCSTPRAIACKNCNLDPLNRFNLSTT